MVHPNRVDATGIWKLKDISKHIKAESVDLEYSSLGAFPNTGSRALFSHGYLNSNVINYLEVGTLGNSVDFGDLTVGRMSGGGGASSNTRACVMGSHVTGKNVIDYVTMQSTGNATDFGDMSVARAWSNSASNQIRGVTAGGETPSPASGTVQDTIDYITISTTGNSVDFGNQTDSRSGHFGTASPTRAIYGGGTAPSVVNTIDYVTIATTGNAIDFGDMTQVGSRSNAASDGLRAVIAVGQNGDTTHRNNMDLIYIATKGNTADFGDMTVAGSMRIDFSNSVRGGWALGYGEPAFVNTNVIDYYIFSTRGDCADFGDNVSGATREASGGMSESHGGLTHGL